MTFLEVLPGLLLFALALVMLGLGLSLRPADFTRLLGQPLALALALGLQLIVLPLVCLAIVILVGLRPAHAIGLLLLAASPGGVSANLFSHLFGGNVAMNISLTAITTVLSIVSLPLVANLAIGQFAADLPVVPLQFGKVLQVIAVVLVPVVVGMLAAYRFPAFASGAETPFKIFSAAVLAAFALIAIVQERESLLASFAALAPAVLLFNIASLGAGYYLSRLVGLDRPIATAISFEIGIHNSTLAIYIALSVLGSVAIGLPAALYSISMYLTGILFGLLVLRRHGTAPARAR